MKSSACICLAVCALVAGIFLLPGNLFSKPPAKATAETLKQLEGEFMKVAAAKGSQGYMSYYADDAVEVPNGGPLILGKIEIEKAWASSTTKTIS